MGRDPAAEPQKPDFGHSEEELSGLHKDLNGQIRQAGPEPSRMEAHVEEGGKFAGVTASRVHYVPTRDGRRFLINTQISKSGEIGLDSHGTDNCEFTA
jgi:hypothetical protein